jgi:hypothetical protein
MKGKQQIVGGKKGNAKVFKTVKPDNLLQGCE